VRGKWYGDNRDLVKWGVLVQLANQHGASRIVQVAYYRREPETKLKIDGTEYPIPDAVVTHFPRDVMDIRRLGLSSGLEVEVVDSTFSHANRKKYTQGVLAKLASFDSPCIIFLDPDTGLEQKGCKVEHVRKSELKEIWESMREKDLLVFYQHKPHEKNWIALRQEQFARALDLPVEAVKIAHSTAADTDVVFFFAKKVPSGSAQNSHT